MRRIIAFLLALLLTLSAAAALADGEKTYRRAVAYPGQNITVTIPAEYHTFYKDDLGLTVDIGHLGATAYIRVRVMPDNPASFREADYFENVWKPYLEKSYNFIPNRPYLKEVGKPQTYTVGGRQMTGQTYSVNFSSSQSAGLVLFDRWDGKLIRYEAYYQADDPDPALSMLGSAVRCVTGHTLAPKATKQSLSRIDCPDQKFSVSALSSYAKTVDAQNGVTVYTQKKGSIPYVIVAQSNDLIMEMYDYLKEQYTPSIKEKYGADLISSSEYENFIIGGKVLPAGVYTYKLQGFTVVLVRVYDSTGPRTVVYTAKYIQGQGDETMLALDNAVSTFQSSAQKIW